MRTTFMRSDIAADPFATTTVRREFESWLSNTLCLSPDERYDVSLAVYEALANAAEHAYAGLPPPHTIALHVSLDADTGTLEATVADHGHWRAPDPLNHLRGRGITLMRGLADHVVIETSPTGTRAHLEWTTFARPF